MQEFSSVTASSYDADSLTPLLNEKAADGWDVVSIVSAGTNIVAYLSRESDGSVTETTVADEPAADDTAAAAAAVAAATPSLGEADAPETAEEPAPTEEPAGWGVAPEETAETADDSVADLAAQVGTDDAAAAAPVLGGADPTPAAEPEPAAEAAPAEPEAAPAPEPEPVAEAAPAAEPAVPAGWYADPSGRFELRYWDGAAWTEHVSRAGQQFTDPPVA